jgi:hypothetical protein
MKKAKELSTAELDALDDAHAAREQRQRRLFTIEARLEAAGLNLDELIELIEARQRGSY